MSSIVRFRMNDGTSHEVSMTVPLSATIKAIKEQLETKYFIPANSHDLFLERTQKLTEQDTLESIKYQSNQILFVTLRQGVVLQPPTAVQTQSPPAPTPKSEASAPETKTEPTKPKGNYDNFYIPPPHSHQRGIYSAPVTPNLRVPPTTTSAPPQTFDTTPFQRHTALQLENQLPPITSTPLSQYSSTTQHHRGSTSTPPLPSQFGTTQPQFGTTQQTQSQFGTTQQTQSQFGTTQQTQPQFGTTQTTQPQFGTTQTTQSQFGQPRSVSPVEGKKQPEAPIPKLQNPWAEVKQETTPQMEFFADFSKFSQAAAPKASPHNPWAEQATTQAPAPANQQKTQTSSVSDSKWDFNFPEPTGPASLSSRGHRTAPNDSGRSRSWSVESPKPTFPVELPSVAQNEPSNAMGPKTAAQKPSTTAVHPKPSPTKAKPTATQKPSTTQKPASTKLKLKPILKKDSQATRQDPKIVPLSTTIQGVPLSSNNNNKTRGTRKQKDTLVDLPVVTTPAFADWSSPEWAMFGKGEPLSPKSQAEPEKAADRGTKALMEFGNFLSNWNQPIFHAPQHNTKVFASDFGDSSSKSNIVIGPDMLESAQIDSPLKSHVQRGNRSAQSTPSKGFNPRLSMSNLNQFTDAATDWSFPSFASFPSSDSLTSLENSSINQTSEATQTKSEDTTKTKPEDTTIQTKPEDTTIQTKPEDKTKTKPEDTTKTKPEDKTKTKQEDTATQITPEDKTKTKPEQIMKPETPKIEEPTQPPKSQLPVAAPLPQISALHCTASGSGLKNAVAGQEAQFIIQSRNAFGKKLSEGGETFVALLHGPELIQAETTDLGDGTYRVTYTAFTKGLYDLFIGANGLQIADSPFDCLVAAGPTDPAHCVASGVFRFAAGTPSRFFMQSRDEFGNNRSHGNDRVTVVFSGPTVQSAKVQDNGNGTYSIECDLSLAGLYEVTCEVNGEKIMGSPFKALVEPGETIASECIATGRGLDGGTQGEVCQFTIRAHDAFGNRKKFTTADPIRFAILQNNEKVAHTTQSSIDQDGTYNVSYVVNQTGFFRLSVTLADDQILGSPFKIQIHPSQTPQLKVPPSPAPTLRDSLRTSQISVLQGKERRILICQSVVRGWLARKQLGVLIERYHQRTQIAHEILETELAYVQSLQILEDHYLRPLRGTQHLIEPEAIGLIFSNIDFLKPLNEVLATRLQQRLKTWGPGQTVADLFVEVAPSLQYAYTTYIQNYDQGLKTLTLYEHKKDFAAFLEKQKRLPQSHGLDIASILIMPVQRLPRYELLLKELLKYTDAQTKDYAQLTLALEKIKSITVFVNENKKRVENAEKIRVIQEKVPDPKVKALFQGTRRLYITEAQFSVVLGKKTKHKYLFLFNDIILVTRASGGFSHKLKFDFVIKLLPSTVVKEVNDKTIQLSDAQQTHKVLLVSSDTRLTTVWMGFLRTILREIQAQHKDQPPPQQLHNDELQNATDSTNSFLRGLRG